MFRARQPVSQPGLLLHWGTVSDGGSQCEEHCLPADAEETLQALKRQVCDVSSVDCSEI